MKNQEEKNITELDKTENIVVINSDVVYESIDIDGEGSKYKTTFNKKYLSRKPYKPKDPKKIVSFMPGTIVEVFTKAGKKVEIGDCLLILDAMKMKNQILAHRKGTIKSVNVAVGKQVTKNFVLIEYK